MILVAALATDAGLPMRGSGQEGGGVGGWGRGRGLGGREMVEGEGRLI